MEPASHFFQILDQRKLSVAKAWVARVYWKERLFTRSLPHPCLPWNWFSLAPIIFARPEGVLAHALAVQAVRLSWQHGKNSQKQKQPCIQEKRNNSHSVACMRYTRIHTVHAEVLIHRPYWYSEGDEYFCLPGPPRCYLSQIRPVYCFLLYW